MHLKLPKINSLFIPKIKSYILLEDYDWHGTDFTLHIPQGFVYHASVPRWLWSIFDPVQLGQYGPLGHDFIYEYDGKMPKGTITPHMNISRWKADWEFLIGMVKDHVRWRYRNLAWLATVLGGKGKYENRG